MLLHDAMSSGEGEVVQNCYVY